MVMTVCWSDVVDDPPGVVLASGEFGVDLNAGRVDGRHVTPGDGVGVCVEGGEDVATDNNVNAVSGRVGGESGGDRMARLLADLWRERQAERVGAGGGEGVLGDPSRAGAGDVGDAPFVDAGKVVWREPVVPRAGQVEAFRRVRVACEVVGAGAGVVRDLKVLAEALRAGGECALLRLKLVDGVDEVAGYLDECFGDLRLVLDSVDAFEQSFDEGFGDGAEFGHGRRPFMVGGVR